MPNELTGEMVKEYGLGAGADVVGIAAAHDFVSAPEGFQPADALKGCRSVIVFGAAVPQEAIRKDDPIGFVDVRNATNEIVSGAVKSAEKWLRAQGYKARAIVGMSGKWVERDGRKVTFGLISLKHAAELAGLGVIGRNYLLTNPEYGNLLWLSAVLTDADLAPDKKAEYHFCNGCNICVEACPSGALDDYPVSFARKKCDGTMFKMVNKKWEIICFNCRKACPHRFGFNSRNDLYIG